MSGVSGQSCRRPIVWPTTLTDRKRCTSDLRLEKSPNGWEQTFSFESQRTTELGGIHCGRYGVVEAMTLSAKADFPAA